VNVSMTGQTVVRNVTMTIIAVMVVSMVAVIAIINPVS